MDENDLGAGCILPVLQAIVTGVLIGGLGAGLAHYAGWKDPALIGLLAGFGAAAFWWMTSVRAWRRAAHPEPYQPEPTTTRARPEPVRVEVRQDDGRHVDYIDLPATAEQLITLAQSVLAGGSLSESAWTGSNGIFTRAEFSALRNELIKRGLASWNNPKTPARGVTLTRGGLAAMRTFAAMGAGDSPTLRKTTTR